MGVECWPGNKEAWRQMIKINLLPVRAIRKKESIRQQISIGILSLVLAFIMIGYFHISAGRRDSFYSG